MELWNRPNSFVHYDNNSRSIKETINQPKNLPFEWTAGTVLSQVSLIYSDRTWIQAYPTKTIANRNYGVIKTNGNQPEMNPRHIVCPRSPLNPLMIDCAAQLRICRCSHWWNVTHIGDLSASRGPLVWLNPLHHHACSAGDAVHLPTTGSCIGWPTATCWVNGWLPVSRLREWLRIRLIVVNNG